jgi:hypothetical protein
MTTSSCHRQPVRASLVVGAAYLAVRWALVGGGRDIAFLTSEGGLETPRRVVVNYAVLVLRFLGWNPFAQGADLAGSARLAALLVIVGLGRRFLGRAEVAPLSCVLGAALVAYVPIAAYVAYTDRFGYLAAVFLSSAVALLVDVAFSRRALISCAAALALVASSVVALAGHGRDWREAGAISEAALDTVLDECARPKPGSMLLFEGLPQRHRSAYVFITYFELALRTRYGRSDLRVARADDACARPEAGSAGAHAAAWRWDPRELRLRACTPSSACEAAPPEGLAGKR